MLASPWCPVHCGDAPGVYDELCAYVPADFKRALVISAFFQ